MGFRSVGSLASFLFPSSSSSSSNNSSTTLSRRASPSRKGTPVEPYPSGTFPSGLPAVETSGEAGEFGEMGSGKDKIRRASSRSTINVGGPSTPPLPSNGFRPFAARRRSSDRNSTKSTGPSQFDLTRTPPPLSSSTNSSSRSSPKRPVPNAPSPALTPSSGLVRSGSSLGELDLGPELRVDTLSTVFSSPTFGLSSTSSQGLAAAAPSSSSYRASAGELSASSSSQSNQLNDVPLVPPAHRLGHSRSDSAPSQISRPVSPVRPVYYAQEMTLAGSGQVGVAMERKSSSASVEGLAGQALDGVELWQQDVWVTLRGGASPDEFYANPRTGDCSWEPPTGALVLPIPDEGQWWELCDLSQDGTVYYFQTKTKATSWTRPEGLVIPLSMIQLRNLGFIQPQSSSAASSSAAPGPTKLTKEPRRRTISALAPSSNRHRPKMDSKKQSAPPVTFAALPSPAAARRASSKPRSAPQQQSSLGAAEERDPPPIPSLVPETPPRPKTPTRRDTRSISSPVGGSPMSERPRLGRLATQLSSKFGGGPKSGPEMMASPMSLVSTSPVLPIRPITPLKSKRLSTGEHFVLPSDLSSAIQQFAVADFSDKYLSSKHTEGGLRKRKIPRERVMRWQKDGINEPLLNLESALKPLALKTFRIIQRAMGDRTKAVDVPSLTTSSSARGSFLKMPNRPTLTEREKVLTEVRYLLWAGITHKELRDEAWSQILKQLSGNPSLASIVRGWEMLCLLSTTFSPSVNMEGFVHGFIQSDASSTVEDEEVASKIRTMAAYCLLKLKANKPARGKPPTILEIESAMGAAFYPSTFGSTLEDTMAKQALLYPDERVPIVLPFLANGIIAMDGLKTEGIFRVPGDSDQVAMVKDRIDRGRYDLEGADDVNVLCSLLKLWLRELQEPIVPMAQYSTALLVSANPKAVCGFVRSLPEMQRNVFLFLVSFLQMLVKHDNETKMSLQNLALVFAPSIFRCPDEELNLPNLSDANVPTAFVNSGYERAFIISLLQEMKPAELGYDPYQGIPPNSLSPDFTTRPSTSSPSPSPQPEPTKPLLSS